MDVVPDGTCLIELERDQLGVLFRVFKFHIEEPENVVSQLNLKVENFFFAGPKKQAIPVIKCQIFLLEVCQVL